MDDAVDASHVLPSLSTVKLTQLISGSRFATRGNFHLGLVMHGFY